jgi:WD40 repeat protein
MDQPRFGGSSAIALSKDLMLLAFGLRESRVKLGHTGTREFTEWQTGHPEVSLVSLSPDGTMLITGGRGSSLQWWKLQPNAHRLRTLQAQQALFSPEGKTLATVQGQEIQLWDVATQSVRVQCAVTSPPAFVAFSTDGRILATTDNPLSVGNAISLWNTTTGALLGVCSGHKQTVWSVAFSPDRKTLASASHDGTVKLWNLKTQQELLTLRWPGETPRGLLFAPDGATLVVGSSSRPVPNSSLRFLRAPIPGDPQLARALNALPAP